MIRSAPRLWAVVAALVGAGVVSTTSLAGAVQSRVTGSASANLSIVLEYLGAEPTFQATAIGAQITPADTSGANPTGSVELLEGSLQLGAAELPNAASRAPNTVITYVNSTSVYELSVGTHLLTMKYSGDALYAPSTTTMSIDIALSPTYAALDQSTKVATFVDQPLHFVVDVSSGSYFAFAAVPTGTVSASVAGLTLASCTNVAVAPALVDRRPAASASCEVGADQLSTPGRWPSEVSYSGDANFSASSSKVARSVEVDWPFGAFVSPKQGAVLPRWRVAKSTWIIEVRFSFAPLNGSALSDSVAAAVTEHHQMAVRLIDPTVSATNSASVLSGGWCSWSPASHVASCTMATPHGLAVHKNYRICLYGATAKTSGAAGVAPCESVSFK